MTDAQAAEVSSARAKLSEAIGKNNKTLNNAKINPIRLPEHTEFNGRRYSNKTGYEIGTDEEIIAARKVVAAVKQKTADIVNKPQKRLTPDDWKTSGTLDEFNASKQALRKLRGEATEPQTYIKKVTDPDNQHYIVNQPWFKKLDSNAQQEYFDIKQQSRALGQQTADQSGKATNKIRVADKENAGLLEDFRDNGNRLHAWRMTNDGEAYISHLLKAAKQRAIKYNAIPKNQTPKDVKKIKAIYQEARDKTIKTGIPHEVDHIFPLQGKSFKGKHTPENLQVVPMQWNRAKRNTPDNDWTKLIYPKGLL